LAAKNAAIAVGERTRQRTHAFELADRIHARSMPRRCEVLQGSAYPAKPR
jgi:hypothetical protein